MRPRGAGEYLVTTIGAWLGAAIGAGLGALIWRILTATDDGVTRENLTTGRLLLTLAAMLTIPVICCLGPAIGSWGTLRLAGSAAAGLTGFALALGLPLLVALTLAATPTVRGILDPGRTWQIPPACLLVPALILGPPLARCVARQRVGPQDARAS